MKAVLTDTVLLREASLFQMMIFVIKIGLVFCVEAAKETLVYCSVAMYVGTVQIMHTWHY